MITKKRELGPFLGGAHISRSENVLNNMDPRMATWKTLSLAQERCAALVEQEATSFLSESKKISHEMNSYF